METNKKWYVVYTYPNRERKINGELNKRKIATFFPTQKVIRQWSDRKKTLEIPLWSNYVFVNVSSKEMWTILMLDGVVRFVSFEGKPAVVGDTEIDAIKKLISGGNVISNEHFCLKGDKVQVKSGPLSGLVGKVANQKGKTRFYVELETVHQILSVDIEASLLEKVIF